MLIITLKQNGKFARATTTVHDWGVSHGTGHIEGTHKIEVLPESHIHVHTEHIGKIKRHFIMWEEDIAKKE